MKTKIVYFIGAGCSKNFGYPLTSGLMPKILENLKANNLFQLNLRKSKYERDAEQELMDCLYLLYPGLKDIDPETERGFIPSIVDVLSLIDHLWFYNIPPHPQIGEEKLSRLRFLMNRAVTEVILDFHLEDDTPKQTALLKKFKRFLNLDSAEIDTTVITTNYDVLIDQFIKKEMRNHNVDYGIPYREVLNSKLIYPVENAGLKYYKLHGSINWLKCDLCGHYYINPDGSIAALAFDENISDVNMCICNSDLRLKSVLITPSLVRDVRDSNILQIWKAAIEAIRQADHIYFIGYSLPGEDIAIKSLLLRGLNGKVKKRKVDVIQFGDASFGNYRNLFGKDFRFHNQGFDVYLDNLYPG